MKIFSGHQGPARIQPLAYLALGLVALALMAAAPGCGYHLVREKRATLPAGVSSIAVILAKNRTIEAGLEDVFTMELKKRLAADRRAPMVPPGQADAHLKCTLEAIQVVPVSFNQEGRISAEGVIVQASCNLVIPDSESVVWQTGSLAASEEFPVGNDYLVNEEAKQRAIEECARDLAESVRTLLFDDF